MATGEQNALFREVAEDTSKNSLEEPKAAQSDGQPATDGSDGYQPAPAAEQDESEPTTTAKKSDQSAVQTTAPMDRRASSIAVQEGQAVTSEPATAVPASDTAGKTGSKEATPAPRLIGRKIGLTGEGDCYFLVAAYFLTKERNDLEKAAEIRKDCAAKLAMKLFGMELDKLEKAVITDTANMVPNEAFQKVSNIEVLDQELAKKFDRIKRDTGNGGNWPMAAWVYWLQFMVAEVAKKRKEVQKHPLAVHASKCFQYTCWGDADFVSAALQLLYPEWSLRWYFSEQDQGTDDKKSFNFLQVSDDHFDAIEFEPEITEQKPLQEVKSTHDVADKSKDPILKLRDKLSEKRVSLCSKCKISYMGCDCLCFWCLIESTAVQNLEEVKRDGEALANTSREPVAGPVVKCALLEVKQQTAASGPKNTSSQAPAQKKGKRILFVPYWSATAEVKVEALIQSLGVPAEIEWTTKADQVLKAIRKQFPATQNDPVIDIVHLYPTRWKDALQFTVADLKQIRDGGVRIVLTCDEHYLEGNPRLIRAMCAHMDVYFRVASRIIFFNQVCAAAAESLVLERGYPGHLKKLAPEAKVQGPELLHLLGDLPAFGLAQFDPHPVDNFFVLKGPDDTAGHRWVYETLNVGEDAAWLRIHRITDEKLAKGARPWSIAEFKSYLDAVAIASERKPAGKDKPPIKAVRYRCLPERLRWLVWALRYKNGIIDCVSDAEIEKSDRVKQEAVKKKITQPEAPKQIGSMRSWHADTKQALPVIKCPGEGDLHVWLNALAEDFGKPRLIGASEDQKRTAMYHKHVRRYKHLPNNMGESVKDKDWEKYSGYVEITGNGTILVGDGRYEMQNGFLGFAQEGGGDRLVYDYVNHIVYLTPQHYQSESEGQGAFYEVIEIDREEVPKPWPYWIVVREPSGLRRDRRKWLETVRTTETADRQLNPLDYLIFRALTRVAKSFFANTKASGFGEFAQEALIQLWQEADGDPGFLGIEELSAPTASAKQGKNIQKNTTPKKKDLPPLALIKIDTLDDVIGAVQALGEDVDNANKVTRVLQAGKSLVLLNKPNIYAYPLQLPGIQRAMDGYKHDYPSLLQAGDSEPLGPLRILTTGVTSNPSTLACSVAHWICECTRNWRQMPILLLFTNLGVSSTQLALAGLIPIADGGWKGNGTWGLQNNRHAEDKALAQEDGDNTPRNSRIRFTYCVYHYMELTNMLDRFEKDYVDADMPEQEVEDWLVEQLNTDVKEALKLVKAALQRH